MKLRAGWISTSVSSGVVAFESISVQIGQRSPVVVSMTTTGWFGSA